MLPLKGLCAPYWVKEEMLQQACPQHLGLSVGSEGLTQLGAELVKQIPGLWHSSLLHIAHALKMSGLAGKPRCNSYTIFCVFICTHHLMSLSWRWVACHARQR